jgi:Predicted transcriptional regulators
MRPTLTGMNSDRLKAAIGANVKAIRERRGWNQDQLGEAVGRTYQAISLIERGETLPPLSTLGAVATVLGVSLADLLSEESLPVKSRRSDLLKRVEVVLADFSDDQLETAAKMLTVLREGFRR